MERRRPFANPPQQCSQRSLRHRRHGGRPGTFLDVASSRKRQAQRAHEISDRRGPIPQDFDRRPPVLGGPPDSKRRGVGVQRGAELHAETRETRSRGGGEDEVAPMEQQEKTAIRFVGAASKPLGKRSQARSVDPAHPKTSRLRGRLVLLGNRRTRHRAEQGPVPEGTGRQRSKPESSIEFGGGRSRGRSQRTDKFATEPAHRSGTRAFRQGGVSSAIGQRNHGVAETAPGSAKRPESGLHRPGRFHRGSQVRLRRRRRDEIRRQTPPHPTAIARPDQQMVSPKGDRHGAPPRTETKEGQRGQHSNREDGFSLAVCGKTHAAFDGRSIPAEPRRFAALIVAFRPKYTRYSGLTRLVSRAPRPSRRSRGFHHRLLAVRGKTHAAVRGPGDPGRERHRPLARGTGEVVLPDKCGDAKGAWMVG